MPIPDGPYGEPYNTTPEEDAKLYGNPAIPQAHDWEGRSTWWRTGWTDAHIMGRKRDIIAGHQVDLFDYNEGFE